MDDDYVTVKEAADMIQGAGWRGIQRWAGLGEIPGALKQGARKWAIPRTWVASEIEGIARRRTWVTIGAAAKHWGITLAHCYLLQRQGKIVTDIERHFRPYGVRVDLEAGRKPAEPRAQGVRFLKGLDRYVLAETNGAPPTHMKLAVAAEGLRPWSYAYLLKASKNGDIPGAARTGHQAAWEVPITWVEAERERLAKIFDAHGTIFDVEEAVRLLGATTQYWVVGPHYCEGIIDLDPHDDLDTEERQPIARDELAAALLRESKGRLWLRAGQIVTGEGHAAKRVADVRTEDGKITGIEYSRVPRKIAERLAAFWARTTKPLKGD